MLGGLSSSRIFYHVSSLGFSFFGNFSFRGFVGFGFDVASFFREGPGTLVVGFSLDRGLGGGVSPGFLFSSDIVVSLLLRFLIFKIY
jgi:hypothetical protein